MSFLGEKQLGQLLTGSNIIAPFSEQNIKNGSYELCLGEQVFQTDTKPRSIKTLKDKQEVYIEPGQFALLLTEETVNIPKNKIAFISIKASIKFKGLINVSGFHVDSGFEGKLLFSVYNAGPATIVLNRGTKYFPIWFANLNSNEEQDYKGIHDKQQTIPNEPVEFLSQGELSSPNILNKKIDDVRHLKTKIEWVVLALLGVVTTIAVKSCSDVTNLKAAIETGYTKKSIEVVADSINASYQTNLHQLNKRIDSLQTELNNQSSLQKSKQ